MYRNLSSSTDTFKDKLWISFSFCLTIKSPLFRLEIFQVKEWEGIEEKSFSFGYLKCILVYVVYIYPEEPVLS